MPDWLRFPRPFGRAVARIGCQGCASGCSDAKGAPAVLHIQYIPYLELRDLEGCEDIGTKWEITIIHTESISRISGFSP